MFKLIIDTFKKELNRQLEIMKLQKRMFKILKVKEVLLDESIIQKDVESAKTLFRIENNIEDYYKL